MPAARLSLDDYGPAPSPHARDAADRTYVSRAAVIDGFEFDGSKRRVPRGTVATTDQTHWLALEVALAAVEHAGIDFKRVDRSRIGVIVGNSLTGETSRANLLRLRWPYVRNALSRALDQTGISDAAGGEILRTAERTFKDTFPEPNEDSLAGALSNVIAGRIANYLDLHGGAFAVDGACASSLLAVAMACDGIAAGRWDMVIAGGVDISLDPLELVGFARVGAMSRGTMRVYDERSDGFLPGEGAGFVVLESARSAAGSGRRAWARVNGAGISSDGAGGITAPSSAGQSAAMRRAYEQAGYPMHTVRFVEGHGTGTPVGDRVELAALHDVAGPLATGDLRTIGLTSAKTLFGHTKAASGVAGFIKAVLAVNQRVLPPLPRADRPHETLRAPGSAFYALAGGEVLAPTETIRAAVSGAGFGGINCHITVSSPDAPPIDLGGPNAAALLASHQGTELLLARAGSADGLDAALATLQADCEGMSDGELPDLCAHAARRLGNGAWRAAIAATDADDLLAKLVRARALLAGWDGTAGGVHPASGEDIMVGHAATAPRIGFLLPGQGAQFLGMGAGLAARFAWAADRLRRWDAAFPAAAQPGLIGRILPPLARAAHDATLAHWQRDLRDTRWAQPAIAATALNWAERLAQLGVRPDAVAGHSLGELPALSLAGVIDEAELIEIVRVRSSAAAEGSAGVMSSLACPPEQAAAFAHAASGYCVLANHNAPDLSAIAGEPDAVAAVERSAAAAGIASVRLDVSNAFHSRYMDAASEALAALDGLIGGARTLAIPFASALHGRVMPGAIDPVAYCSAQVVAPVRYVDAIRAMAEHCDLLVELGPGRVQTGLVRRILGPQMPVFAVEPSHAGADRAFCLTLGQLFVRGCPVQSERLFDARFVRPFTPARDRVFIANPCEAPAAPTRPHAAPLETTILPPAPPPPAPAARERQAPDALAAIRQIVAEMTGYGEDTVEPGSRLGGDLHLDSIKISEVGARLSRLGWSGGALSLLQGGTVAEIAASLEPAPAEPGADGPSRAIAVPVAAIMRDLGVHVFTFAWTSLPRPTGCPPPVGEGPIALFFAAGQAVEAMRLSAALAASRQACVLLPWHPHSQIAAAPGAPVSRVLALLPPIAADDAGHAASYLVALGRLLAGGVQDLLIVALQPAEGGTGGQLAIDGLATDGLAIDGLGLGATALLEGSARRVRVLRLSAIPEDFEALRAPTAQPLELLRLDLAGTLQRASLQPADAPAPGVIPLQDGDTVLVSGGLRGITAECTLALATETRLRLIVAGRTEPDDLDPETLANLRRLQAASEETVYVACDVADAGAVHAALSPVLHRMGALRGIVHGAGVNLPATLGQLDAAKVRREIAIKSTGLANLLALADLDELRLCIGLGSVIAVTGMHGNAGYALANEIMAAQLAALQAGHPHIAVACPAFSVWRDVGMGAKLTIAADLGGEPIAVQAGTDAFLAAVRGAWLQPRVVAPPMTGLATWRHLRAADPALDARFLTPLLVHEPGLALLARPSLSRAADTYLNHHRFNGTTLFPTAFAIEAFVSAAIELGAIAPETPVDISDLILARPIVVDDVAGRVIEIDARRVAGIPGMVQVMIGDPGRTAADPVFSGRVSAATGAGATFSLDRAASGETPARELSDHLYAGLLFQGQPFQRIEEVLKLDLTDPVCRGGWFRVRRAPAGALHAIDPFFLDALLQTAQVLVPQDVCLPRAIARVTIGAALRRGGDTLVEARITERTADGYICTVVAVDPDDGALVARLDGYNVGIVERAGERPTLDDLLDPARFDVRRLAAALSRLRQLGLDPACALAGAALAGGEERESRRRRAQNLVAGMFPDPAPQMEWDADGRPSLRGMAGCGISISHTGGRMIAVRGPAGLACDLEQVRARTRDEWLALLPPGCRELLPELGSRLANPDAAAATLWTAHECLIKAGISPAPLRIVRCDAAGTVLSVVGRADAVFATIVDLALAGRCVLAVLLPGAAVRPGNPAAERIFRHGFRPTFGDVTTGQRTVAAHTMFRWIGQARELAMADIHAPLADAFGPAAGHAMLTNFTEVDLHAPIRFGQALDVTVWLDRILDGQPSAFELGLVWTADGAIAATARQRLTWVRTRDGQVFRPEPFPPFFRDFMDARRLPPEAITGLFGGLPLPFADERVWRRTPHALDGPAAVSLTLDTDASHSNFVGNIYFSHYATLFERTVLKLAASLPAGQASPALAVSSLRIDHLGEAMPGDRLVVTAELDEVGAGSIGVTGQFGNHSHGAATIAIGRARLRPLHATGGDIRWGAALAPAVVTPAAVTPAAVTPAAVTPAREPAVA